MTTMAFIHHHTEPHSTKISHFEGKYFRCSLN